MLFDRLDALAVFADYSPKRTVQILMSINLSSWDLLVPCCTLFSSCLNLHFDVRRQAVLVSINLEVNMLAC